VVEPRAPGFSLSKEGCLEEFSLRTKAAGQPTDGLTDWRGWTNQQLSFCCEIIAQKEFLDSLAAWREGSFFPLPTRGEAARLPGLVRVAPHEVQETRQGGPALPEVVDLGLLLGDPRRQQQQQNSPLGRHNRNAARVTATMHDSSSSLTPSTSSSVASPCSLQAMCLEVICDRLDEICCRTTAHFSDTPYPDVYPPQFTILRFPRKEVRASMSVLLTALPTSFSS
jgi:hypothetical protein